MMRKIYAVYVDKKRNGTWRKRRQHNTIFGAVFDLLLTARRMSRVSLMLKREWRPCK